MYKQKVKHLLYEHQNSITQLKTEGEQTVVAHQREFRGREQDLNKDKRWAQGLDLPNACPARFQGL